MPAVTPAAGDADPSPLLGNLPGSLRHRSRITGPAVRAGWLRDGPGPSDRRGADEFVAFLRSTLGAPNKPTVHQVHAPEIEVTSPSTARGVWALQDVVRLGAAPVGHGPQGAGQGGVGDGRHGRASCSSRSIAVAGSTNHAGRWCAS